MLEVNLQKLIKKILEVERSHLDSNDEELMLSHNWQFVFDDYDGWVILNVFSEELGGY